MERVLPQSEQKHILPPFSVLIVAAGNSTRFGGKIPKQYAKLQGKPVLRHTIEAFLDIPGLQEVKVVIHRDHADFYEIAVKGINLPAPIIGGESRKESSFKGLSSFYNLRNDDVILIHDCARPFINREYIEKCVQETYTHGAACLAVPVSDTLKYDCGEYASRENLWALQTPQGFRYGLIMEAHKKSAENKSITDDTALVKALGHEIKIVESSRRNIKITTPEDWIIAENFLNGPLRSETRTGQGFDVHAFDRESSGPIRLGGIDIPHTFKLKGHSDADVALHAITDALLGAIGCGDIGLHFPPADNEWKGKDSSFFLEKACLMMQEKKGKIVNIDLTVICETPKIGPVRDTMRSRIAAICGIEDSRVNVKGTTTEKLGFTGRGEGIAAQAIVSIEMDFN